MRTDLEQADILRRAAAQLRTGCWIQGSLASGNGRCAVGAIFDASSYGNFQAIEAVEMGLGIFGTFPPSGMVPLAEWNDAKGRTATEVIEALESTALALEVRHLSHETQAPLEVVVTEAQPVGV